MATILYHGEPNGPSLAVLAALYETGADTTLAVECRTIDLLAGDRHTIPALAEPLARDMGVEGEGPVLVVAGEAMTESVFLAQYFDEASGSGCLQPSDPYAHWEMMMWCRQITERLSPAAALLGNLATSHERLEAMDQDAFDACLEGMASADLKVRWDLVRDGEADDAQLRDCEAKVVQAVARCEAQLGDGREWLMGALTIADFETYAWLAGMVSIVPQAFAEKALTGEWMDRVKARPSVARARARARTAQPERAFAPGPEINRWG
ncbi:glutathione S-transferase family protein [Novosphingobium sp. 1949]|uniref:Glutathione S-transferase family protein n=1 Tax=Novosphingobium organovorum TaxID=2930092 RepID=A0ABT0BAC0_9SPHN|nr:glutathione S-transferase family protein [Novosphingobium organovorum]MCJ2181815.1 glutathione S-transferase family protein [Novosphingobium organovorum]